VVTGGGVSLAIDTTLHLIGKLYGEAARDDVARLPTAPIATNLGILSTVADSARPFYLTVYSSKRPL
jgi:hypothetical protein